MRLVIAFDQVLPWVVCSDPVVPKPSEPQRPTKSV
jgi:hypothetical protein